MLLFVPLLTFKSLLTKKDTSGFSVYTSKIEHRTPEGTWVFQLFGKNIVKTTFQPHGYTRNEQPSNAVVLKPYTGKKTILKAEEQIIEFGNVAKVLLKQKKHSYDFNGEVKDVMAGYFSEHEYRGFRFDLQEDEQVFGGGERALPMSRRGFGFSLNNCPAFSYGEGQHNLNFSVPFIISSKGYGIFFDNVSKGYLDIGRKKTGVLEAGFSSGELTFYIINGKNPDEILRNYTELVGRQSIPGRWVFGNLMSRFGYRSEEQLMSIVAQMKQEKFPVDAVILDLFWFGDSIRNTLGNLDWVNNEKWPAPEKMISNLKDQGIKTVLITEPYVVMGSKNYGESKRYHSLDYTGEPYTLTDFYFGFGGLLDMFRKDAQDWFWSKYKKQIDKGVAGWWGDLGEPETHPGDTYHNLKDLGFKRLFGADEVHNVYGHYWNKMLFDKYAEHYPQERLFNLNRAGYAGSQRYSIFPWSGDVGRNWSGFRAQLPIMLGMSLSGVPYIHADAGGFAMGEKDPELYTRWLQFASFTPVFRPHGTALEGVDESVPNIESEPVFYPEPHKSIVRKYIQLRYDLMPYNYTLAYEQATAGKPLTRPMFYYDADDAELVSAEDQYMWGDHILVAPVLEKGAVERSLYLPKGVWYNLFTNEKLKGGRRISEKIDISDMPLYVKAGSFIPSCTGLSNMADYRSDSLIVTYYPGSADSSYTMYDDDGKTNRSLEKGKYELLKFKSTVNKGSLNLQLTSNGGKFVNKPSVRQIVFKVPGLSSKPSSVTINGEVIKVVTQTEGDQNTTFNTPTWHQSTQTLFVSIQFSGTKQNVVVHYER